MIKRSQLWCCQTTNVFKVYDNIGPSFFTGVHKRRNSGFEPTHTEILLLLEPKLWGIVSPKLN